MEGRRHGQTTEQDRRLGSAPERQAGADSPAATSSSQPARDQGDIPNAAPAVYIGSTPTPEDLLFLPRVADKLPHGAFLTYREWFERILQLLSEYPGGT